MQTITSNKRKLIISFTVLVVLILALVISYLAGTYYYSQRFIPGTTVNGIACSGKTVEEAEQLLQDSVAEYSLTLKERGGTDEVIAGSSIDLNWDLESDDTLRNTLASQPSELWFTGFFSQTEINMAPSIVYSEDKLEEQISSLDAFQSENITKPENAAVSDYESGKGYEIVPEVEGNRLKSKRTKRLIGESISALEPELDLDAASCYSEPSIRSDDEDLAALVESMNKYIDTTITIAFSKKKTEVVDGDLIHDWIKVSKKKLTVTLDEDKVSDYVSELASKYNTIFTPHSFTTTSGEKITIENGDYGWWLNQNGTRDALIEALDSFESQTIEPVYLQEAASHGKHDYGKTYVEVDLGSQYLYFYEDGECKLTSSFVSGNMSNGHATPGGIYSITYKQRNHRMVGADYDVFTYYWMPFNGDIGFHDATWRGSFGGTIYQYNGSHGCVNMPYEKAQSLYNLVSAGTPVICYY